MPKPRPAKTPSEGTRERLIRVATAMIAEQGYAAATVRNICREADAAVNMVHHFFGSKEGLFDAILAGIGEDLMGVPMRIIEEPPESRQDFEARLKLFFHESLHTLIEHRLLYAVVMREQITLPAFVDYHRSVQVFLTAARCKQIVGKHIEPEMISGWIMDRLGNQVIHADWLREAVGNDVVSDEAYRKRWARANFEFLLGGLLSQK